MTVILARDCFMADLTEKRNVIRFILYDPPSIACQYEEPIAPDNFIETHWNTLLAEMKKEKIKKKKEDGDRRNEYVTPNRNYAAIKYRLNINKTWPYTEQGSDKEPNSFSLYLLFVIIECG